MLDHIAPGVLMCPIGTVLLVINNRDLFIEVEGGGAGASTTNSRGFGEGGWHG